MLETIQDFGKNLTAEVMDVPRNFRDLIGGTIAMTIIDNSQHSPNGARGTRTEANRGSWADLLYLKNYMPCR